MATTDPAKPAEPVKMAKHQRFVQPQNLLGILFLGILAFNLVVMGIDFPRFTVVAVLLVILLVDVHPALDRGLLRL